MMLFAFKNLVGCIPYSFRFYYMYRHINFNGSVVCFDRFEKKNTNYIFLNTNFIVIYVFSWLHGF